jgi:hypothetical protein
MLGLMPLAMLLAVWCTLILERSTAAYRASAMLEWRLQARAAAEGAAVLVAAGNPARPPAAQRMGDALVTCGAPKPAGTGQMIVPLEVAIRPHGDEETRYATHYQARCTFNGDAWRLLRLEE